MARRTSAWLPALGLVLSLSLALALAAPGAAAARITEFDLPTRDGFAREIAAGPDGALWFVETGKIGRIDTAGGVREFPLPNPAAGPAGIVAGPDGALWFTQRDTSRIGRITPSGAFSGFSIPTRDSRPVGITAGPGGALWFTELAGARIARITTGGTVTEFPLQAGEAPGQIAAGADGALWFVDQTEQRIGRLTPGGALTHFALPDPGSQPRDIVAGPDGALWFTETVGNRIGRITTAGAITEFPVPTPASEPGAIAAGPDGALWFTETTANKIGRITPSGAISDFRVPTGLAYPAGIAAGSDGALWFTEPNVAKIGRITIDQPPEDSIDGTLHTLPACEPPVCSEQPRYIVRASTGAAGGGRKGTVEYMTGERSGVDSQSGAVTCARVSGTRATVGVNLGPGFRGTLPERAVLVFFEDDGPAGSDRFAVQEFPAGGAPSTCPLDPPAGVALGPGYPSSFTPADPGVVIRDLAPLPSRASHCAEGGWRGYGLPSEAACVKLVEDLARRACRRERARIGRAAFRAQYGLGPDRLFPLLGCVLRTTRW